jgi:hypothetical protein
MHRSFAFVRAILTAAVTAVSSAYANAQQFFLAVAAAALLMSVIAAPATASPLWTMMSGSATVDLGAQTVQFNVIGLTVAQGDAIGTTGGVTQVAGTVVCLGFGASSTPFLPLSPQGDASSGVQSVVLPAGCTTSNMRFLIIRPLPVLPFAEYIAFGSSMFTH